MPSATVRTALFSRQQIGGVWTIDDFAEHPGDIFFVDSGSTSTGGDTTGHGKSPDEPFLTLDYAVGRCTANQGDTIYVCQGHAENLAADSAVDVDVAGLSIIGLGTGSTRPTFTATAVAGDFKLAAAGTYIENILFLGGIDATTGIVEVSAADCQIIDCEYRDSTGQATDIIITTAAADRLLIDGLKVIGAAAAGCNSAIALVGADDVIIRNFWIYGNFAVGGIDLRTTASNRVHIHSGQIWTENVADIGIVDTITASTGQIGPDIQIMLQDNAANLTEAVTGATFHLMDPVYVCNLPGEKGALINWTASTDA